MTKVAIPRTQDPVSGSRRKARGGFTLVELLVVIGIIALLVGILMPALTKAKESSRALACASNMRQVGLTLLMYSQDYNGWIVPVGPPSDGAEFPKGMGTNRKLEERWTTVAFRPAVVNPKEMVCPSDPDLGAQDATDPELMKLTNPDVWLIKHSYVLNGHIIYEDIRYGRTHGADPVKTIVMGEKKTAYYDYYMEVANGQPPKGKPFTGLQTDIDKTEPNRHGLNYGSNYLFLDIHVAPIKAKELNRVKIDHPTFVDNWQILDPQDVWGTGTTTGSGSSGTGTGTGTGGGKTGP